MLATPPPVTPPPPPGSRAITRSDLREKALFVLVSGFGWLLDFGVFYALVYWAHQSAFVANYVSSLVGAATAFSLYSLSATYAQSLPSGRQLVVYVIYQLAAITAFSMLVGWLSGSALLVTWLSSIGLGVALAAPAAKIIATPFNMIANYLAAKIVLNFVAKQSQGAA